MSTLAKSYPLDASLITEKFDVKHVRTGGTYKNIVGLKMQGIGDRYACRICFDRVWLTWGAVRAHLGQEHPSPATAAKRQAREAQNSHPAKPQGKAQGKASAQLTAETIGDDTYVSQDELALGVVPSTVPAPPVKPDGRGRMGEAELDRIAPLAAGSVAELIDHLVQSRAQARQDMAEVISEREQYKRQRDHALEVLGRMETMIMGLRHSLEAGK